MSTLGRRTVSPSHKCECGALVTERGLTRHKAGTVHAERSAFLLALSKRHTYRLGVSKTAAKALMHAGLKRFFSVVPEGGKPMMCTTASVGNVLFNVDKPWKLIEPVVYEVKRFQVLMRKHHGDDAPNVLWGMTLTELEDGTDRLRSWLMVNGATALLVDGVRNALLHEALRELKARMKENS